MWAGPVSPVCSGSLGSLWPRTQREAIAGARVCGAGGRAGGRVGGGNAHSSRSEGGAALRPPPPGPWVPCLLPWSSRLHEESPCIQGLRPGHWTMCIHSGGQASLAPGAKFPLCPQTHQIHNSGAKTGQWKLKKRKKEKPLRKGRRSRSILFGGHLTIPALLSWEVLVVPILPWTHFLLPVQVEVLRLFHAGWGITGGADSRSMAGLPGFDFHQSVLVRQARLRPGPWL